MIRYIYVSASFLKQITPENTRHEANFVLMLARRFRRRPNIKATLCQRRVLAGTGNHITGQRRDINFPNIPSTQDQ